VVGEGPSGDSMIVTVGWNPQDWPGDIGRVVTCVSIDGRAVPELATSTVRPPNTGSLMLDLTLPAGDPGALVCAQSVLVGKGDAPGRTPPTRPACFKLRSADPPPPTKVGGRTSGETSGETPAPGGPSASSPDPAGPAAPGARAPTGSPPGPSPVPDPASTPPSRAAHQAAAGPLGTPTVRATAPAAPVRTAAAAAAAVAPPAASPVAADAAGAPAPALARTGIEHQTPLAGAGILLALGGAAIILGEPRRRAWSTRPA
jgi:hypothetical protein